MQSLSTPQDHTHLRCAAWLLNGNEQYGVGGPVLTLARGLRAKNWQTHFFLLTDGWFAEQCRGEDFATAILDAQAPRLDYRSRLLDLPAYFFSQRQFARDIARRLAAGLREIGAEHLGVRWPFHVAAAGGAAQIARVPCYWMMPNIVSRRWPFALDRRWYRHLCLTRGIKPLANSQYTADSLGGEVGQRVLYLAADDGRFNPETVKSFSRSELAIPDDAIVVGIFARLDLDKGQHLLWQAVTELVTRGHDMHLLVVGGPTDGPTAAQLRELAAASQMASRLHLVGWTAEPERYYAAIDFAANARIAPEPFGLSVIEAMLMRKPVMAHALGGPAETVVDGVTGWHVSEANVASLVGGLQRAIDDRPRWSEMSVAALRHAREHFTVARFVENYLRIVDRSAALE